MEKLPIWDGYVHPANLPHVRHCWLWVYCRIPFCGHSRAVPLAPWRIRWGADSPEQLMRRYFRCAMCGTPGCVFGAPLLDGEGIEAFPAREALVRLGGTWPAQSGEVKWQTVERMQAAYMAKYPTGDALGEFRGDGRLRLMCNLYSVKAGQKHIADTARAVRDLTGNMPPMPAVFPNRHGARSARGARRCARIVDDALGLPAAIHPRQQAAQPLPHECPQHRQPLLADLPQEPRQPLPGTGQQLCRAGQQSRLTVDLDLVRPKRKPAADVLRRHLAH